MSQNYEYFGKYILLEKLAMGGMAEVWLARAPGAGGIGKFVAIKKILPQYSDNPEFIQMFKDEAQIAINLSHGNIVSIYEFGLEKNQLFLVMDYVEGRNLRQYLNKMKQATNRFSPDQIIYVVKEVAAGLDHAHRSLNSATGKPLNITHRDMSPQNVMISFEGEVKIVDFGIAKAESQVEQTKTGTLKGKFGYMSPEQAEGQATDLRTDIFSLGIVLWELLANDRLFLANNEINTLRKIRECQVPSLTKINPNIHPELERITMKALTRDRNLRYQTAAAFHRDLSRFLARHYPDFSPHDFSVFIKTLFTDEILETRRRLIEYAKVPFKATSTKSSAIDDKTLVTFPQAKDPKTTKTSFGTGLGKIEGKTNPTITATQTFSDEDQLITKSPVDAKDPVTSPSLASAADIPKTLDDSQSSFKKNAPLMPDTPTSFTQTPTNESIHMKTASKNIIDDRALIGVEAHLKSQMAAAPPKLNMIDDDGQSPTELKLERTKSKSINRRPNTRKSRSSSNFVYFKFMIIVAFMIATYVVFSTLFPDETKKVEGVVSGLLNPKQNSPAVPTPVKDPTAITPIITKDPTPIVVEKSAGPTDFVRTTRIVVNSIPSGAEVVLNGVSTGKVTPARVEVPIENPFSLTLRLSSYLEYSKSDLTVDLIGNSFTATLQKAMVAFVDIDVKPPRNTKIYIDGQILKEEFLPIQRYAIPANVPVKIRAENIYSGASTEQTVKLKPDQRYNIMLRIPERKPSSR